jgi:CheY-like chemotaxis protein
MSVTILIVDDSATTRAVIKRTIQMCGLEDAVLLEAENGRQGLELARTRKPDLVLADLQMPEMNGVSMTKELLADEATRGIPVVIVTAEPSESTIGMLKQTGVRMHVSKPFTPEAIRKVIGEVLGVSNA